MPALESAGAALSQGRVSDAFAYLFLDQKTVDDGVKADDALRQMNLAKYNSGQMSEQDWLTFQGRQQENQFPTYDDPNGQIFQQEGTNVTAGFVEGAKEGAANLPKAINKALGSAINWTASAIPWQVYVIAIAYLGFVLWPYFFAKKK